MKVIVEQVKQNNIFSNVNVYNLNDTSAKYSKYWKINNTTYPKVKNMFLILVYFELCITLNIYNGVHKLFPNTSPMAFIIASRDRLG